MSRNLGSVTDLHAIIMVISFESEIQKITFH